MKFENLFRTGHFMQAIDILSHHSLELARLLQICQVDMSSIGLGIRIEQVLLVKVKKLQRIALKHRVRNQLLCCKMPSQLDAINSIRTAKVRNIGLRRNTRPTEKNDTLTLVYQFLQPCNLIHPATPYKRLSMTAFARSK